MSQFQRWRDTEHIATMSTKKILTICITFALPLSMIFALPVPNPKSQSGFEQSAVSRTTKVRCEEGFVRDNSGECVPVKKTPNVPNPIGNVFGTTASSTSSTTSTTSTSNTTSTPSTTESPSGSPKAAVLDKLVASLVLVLLFVR